MNWSQFLFSYLVLIMGWLITSLFIDATLLDQYRKKIWLASFYYPVGLMVILIITFFSINFNLTNSLLYWWLTALLLIFMYLIYRNKLKICVSSFSFLFLIPFSIVNLFFTLHTFVKFGTDSQTLTLQGQYLFDLGREALLDNPGLASQMMYRNILAPLLLASMNVFHQLFSINVLPLLTLSMLLQIFYLPQILDEKHIQINLKFFKKKFFLIPCYGWFSLCLILFLPNIYLHVVYNHTNHLSMVLFFFSFISLLLAQKKNYSFLYLAALFAIGFIWSRSENIVLYGIFLTCFLLLSEKKINLNSKFYSTGWKIHLSIAALNLFYFFQINSIAIYSASNRKIQFLVNLLLSSFIVVIWKIVPVLQKKMSIIRYLRYFAYLIPPMVLVALYLTRLEWLSISIFAMFGNLLSSEWLFFWPIIFCCCVIIFTSKNEIESKEIPLFIMFLVTFLFMSLFMRRPFRAGWSDSFNRIIFQFIPVILIFIEMNFRQILKKKTLFLK